MFVLDSLQDKLNFESSVTPHFIGDLGVGRHGVAGLALGMLLGFHSSVVVLSFFFPVPVGIVQWCLYVALLCTFHISEWYVTAVYRPKELGYQSWIINHSTGYTAAQIVSAVEFWVEYSFLSASVKSNTIWIGLCLIGSCIAICTRVAAMVTAGDNFDHIVMQERKDGHELVTCGIYSLFRHPSYVGFYYWSVISQMLLCNPICSFAFAYVSYKFFAGRIPPEEKALVSIYGEQYITYAKKTPIHIPFVKGYVKYEKPVQTTSTPKQQ